MRKVTLGRNLILTILGSALLAGLAWLVSTSAAADQSAVLSRAMTTLGISAVVVAVALLIFLLAYAATAKRRAQAAAELAAGKNPQPDGAAGHSRYTPDGLDKRPVKPSKFFSNMALAFVLIVFISAFAGTGMDMGALMRLPVNIWTYLELMGQGVFQIPDEQVREYWADSFAAMIDSVAIAWIGTLVGALFSVPFGFLAARNMTPLALYIPMRFILSVIRAVPEIVFAIAIFIPLINMVERPGLAGAFALGISSIGTLSKLISEAIEQVDTGPIESVRASGASQMQVIRWAVLPQALPEMIAIWLYRFEVNIRASAILGTLGAGGIGVLLNQVLRFQRDWERTGIAIAVIIIVTIAVDQISAFIRHRVIHGAKARKRSQKTVLREKKPKQQV